MERRKPRPVAQDITGAIGYLEVARHRLESEDLQARLSIELAGKAQHISEEISSIISQVLGLASEARNQ